MYYLLRKESYVRSDRKTQLLFQKVYSRGVANELQNPAFFLPNSRVTALRQKRLKRETRRLRLHVTCTCGHELKTYRSRTDAWLVLWAWALSKVDP